MTRPIARLRRPAGSLALGRADVGDRAMVLQHHDITVGMTRQIEEVNAASSVRGQHQEVIGPVPPPPVRQALHKVERVRQILLARLCDGLGWSAKVAVACRRTPCQPSRSRF